MRQEIFYTFFYVLYVIYAFLFIFIYYANIKYTYVRIY